MYNKYRRKYHESSDLFIFCGHGGGERMLDGFKIRRLAACPAALLWGCSSGKLQVRGIHDAVGTALYYLMAGAPFVVGNLWDVTDKDIDSICMAHMRCLLSGAEQVGNNVSPQPHSIASITDTPAPHVAMALIGARDECRMRNAVGAAPVVYGIPTTLVCRGVQS